MNEFMNQYIINYCLDKRFDGCYVNIKVEIPKDIFEEYFKKEKYFTAYFSYGKIKFKKNMFFLKGNVYLFNNRIKLEEI